MVNGTERFNHTVESYNNFLNSPEDEHTRARPKPSFKQTLHIFRESVSDPSTGSYRGWIPAPTHETSYVHTSQSVFIVTKALDEVNFTILPEGFLINPHPFHAVIAEMVEENEGEKGIVGLDIGELTAAIGVGFKLKDRMGGEALLMANILGKDPSYSLSRLCDRFNVNYYYSIIAAVVSAPAEHIDLLRQLLASKTPNFHDLRPRNTHIDERLDVGAMMVHPDGVALYAHQSRSQVYNPSATYIW
jgi:hypothetical protein